MLLEMTATEETTFGEMVHMVDDQVIVKLRPGKTTTEGGIHLTEEVRPEIVEGLVMTVGPGRLLQDGSRAGRQVSRGHIVVFGSHSKTMVEIGGDDYAVIREGDILFSWGEF